MTITDGNHEHGCVLWPRLAGRLVGWLVVGFDKLLSEIGFLTNGDQCGAKTE